MISVRRSNLLSRTFLSYLALAAAALFMLLVLIQVLARPAAADPTSPPGRGRAGEHGRHKGRPFQSPSCPDGGACP